MRHARLRLLEACELAQAHEVDAVHRVAAVGRPPDLVGAARDRRRRAVTAAVPVKYRSMRLEVARMMVTTPYFEMPVTVPTTGGSPGIGWNSALHPMGSGSPVLSFTAAIRPPQARGGFA